MITSRHLGQTSYCCTFALLPVLTYLLWWQILYNSTAECCPFVKRCNTCSTFKVSCARVTIGLRVICETVLF